MEYERECPHGCGERAWCTICNGRERREEAARQLALSLRKKWWPPKPPDPPRCDRFLRAWNRRGTKAYNWQHGLLEDDKDRYRGPGAWRPTRYAEARTLDWLKNRKGG